MVDPGLQVFMEAHDKLHRAEAAETTALTKTVTAAIALSSSERRIIREDIQRVEQANKDSLRSMQTTLDTLVYQNGGPRTGTRKAWLVHQAAGGVPTAGILGIVYAIARAVGVG